MAVRKAMRRRRFKVEKTTAVTGRCPICGKLMFRTRAAARAAARVIHPSDQMSVYPCGDFFHYGHLPARIRAGDVTRGDYFEPT